MPGRAVGGRRRPSYSSGRIRPCCTHTPRSGVAVHRGGLLGAGPTHIRRSAHGPRTPRTARMAGGAARASFGEAHCAALCRAAALWIKTSRPPSFPLRRYAHLTPLELHPAWLVEPVVL